MRTPVAADAVELFTEPTGTHTRYLVIDDEVAPSLTNIVGLFTYLDDATDDLQILLVTRDGVTAPVGVKNPDQNGFGCVYLIDPNFDNNEGAVVEAFDVDEDGDLIEIEVFVHGFTTDHIPYFVPGHR